MRFLAHNFHHDGLVHAVRDDLADHFLAPSGLFHDLALLCICVGHDYFFSVVPPASSRSRAMVFTRAMSLRRPRIFFRLSVCPMLSWNFSLKSWSLSSRSCETSSSPVKFRTFSDFISVQLSTSEFLANRISSAHLRASQTRFATAAYARPDASLPWHLSARPLPSRTGSCPAAPRQPSDPALPCLYPYAFQPASW